jgi:hypothetical protein
MFNVGDTVRVRASSKFHRGKIGIFEFMGGPEADVVVICVKDKGYSKKLICVDKSHVDVLTKKEDAKRVEHL